VLIHTNPRGPTGPSRASHRRPSLPAGCDNKYVISPEPPWFYRAPCKDSGVTLDRSRSTSAQW
jgi:hypothetical protein